jgi:hypothetical protein
MIQDSSRTRRFDVEESMIPALEFVASSCLCTFSGSARFFSALFVLILPATRRGAGEPQ